MTALFSRRFAIFAFCAAMLSFVFTATPVAADEASAAAFVQNLGNTALMSLTSKDISHKARESRVRDILRKNFDVQAIGRFAMGGAWRTATEAQRSEYMGLFEDMIVQTYTKRFEDYSGQTLKVGKAVKDKNDYLVASQVVQKDGGSPVNLQWRVRDNKVVDVVVEGVSMSVTQRSDFASAMQQGGGTVDALLSSLRKRSKSDTDKG